MSGVSSTRLPFNTTSSVTRPSLSTSTLVTPQSKIVLRRPSFAASSPSSSSPPVKNSETAKPILEDSQPLAYAPFPTCSINLISCASNSGKTQFLTQVIQQRQKFFQDWSRIQRVIYVNGNLRHSLQSHPWSDNSLGLEVVSLPLDDFKDPIASLLPYDVIIVDDLLQVTEEIDYLLKYGTHHHRLYLFLISQACLNSKLYSLLRLAHSLVLLFGNSATSRLAQHLVHTFFLCSETKLYLKAILSIAEKQQDIVLLKLKAVASYRLHLEVLALCGVQKLFNLSWPYCFVYPELGRAENLWKDMDTSTHPMAQVPPLEGDYLEQAFVLVPVHRLQQRPEASHSTDINDQDDCLKNEKDTWNEMAIFLENEISHSFPYKRWQAVKNLARQLLQCSALCITSNYRMIHPLNKPKQQYSIIDFLQVATRKAGPGERQSDNVLKFKPLVNILLKHNVPETFIINKLLLDSGSPARPRFSYARRRQSRHYPRNSFYNFDD